MAISRYNTERRIGTFDVSSQLVHGHGSGADIGLGVVMAKVAILDAHYRHDTGVYTYTALSPEFDLVPEGSVAPRYNWELTKGEDRTYTAEAKRLDDQ